MRSNYIFKKLNVIVKVKVKHLEHEKLFLPRVVIRMALPFFL